MEWLPPRGYWRAALPNWSGNWQANDYSFKAKEK
jgi:hypothetical protein